MLHLFSSLKKNLNIYMDFRFHSNKLLSIKWLNMFNLYTPKTDLANSTKQTKHNQSMKDIPHHKFYPI